MEAISLELLFADMAHVERRLEKDKVPPEERAVLERILVGLQQGNLPEPWTYPMKNNSLFDQWDF